MEAYVIWRASEGTFPRGPASTETRIAPRAVFRYTYVVTTGVGHRLISAYLWILRHLAEIGCRSLVKEYSSRLNPFILRKGSSDIMVFWQIFRQKELELPVVVNPRLIVDAGANVGYSSLWFAQRYPDALIIAIEPEKSNYDILVQHSRNYSNIRPMRAALYHREMDLGIADTGWGAFAFMTVEEDTAGGEKVRAVTIDTVLREINRDRIDILKVDIEGSERELFSKNYESWLPHVGVLLVETHERMKKGSTRSVYEAVRRYEWTEYSRRDKKVFVRKGLPQRAG
jgi:FkbM family methyltransferase